LVFSNFNFTILTLRHWNNTRLGAAGTVFNTILGPKMGLPPASDEMRKFYEKNLKNSIAAFDRFWLKDTPFIISNYFVVTKKYFIFQLEIFFSE
jgi:hypothetical protein